jgi:hypothetical protein
VVHDLASDSELLGRKIFIEVAMMHCGCGLLC